MWTSPFLIIFKYSSSARYIYPNFLVTKLCISFLHEVDWKYAPEFRIQNSIWLSMLKIRASWTNISLRLHSNHSPPLDSNPHNDFSFLWLCNLVLDGHCFRNFNKLVHHMVSIYFFIWTHIYHDFDSNLVGCFSICQRFTWLSLANILTMNQISDLLKLQFLWLDELLTAVTIELHMSNRENNKIKIFTSSSNLISTLLN